MILWLKRQGIKELFDKNYYIKILNFAYIKKYSIFALCQY